jgi:CRP-like cAMP-binding protein
MRRIHCTDCRARPGNPVCDLPTDVLGDFRAAGSAMLYRPRQVIFGEGMPAAALYLVCHGAVKLYHSDRFGRDYILEIAAPGSLLGELSLDEDDTMSVSAEALTEVQVLYLPRNRLAAFVERHPETAVRLLAALSRELAGARQKVRDLAFKSAESRLAGLLLQLAGTRGGMSARLQLPYTRRALAEMIGVSTETAIRLLATLKRKGTIATEGREVVIADAAQLTRIARHDDPTGSEIQRDDNAQRES